MFFKFVKTINSSREMFQIHRIIPGHRCLASPIVDFYPYLLGDSREHCPIWAVASLGMNLGKFAPLVCSLCVAEKYFILCKQVTASLNRSELLGLLICRKGLNTGWFGDMKRVSIPRWCEMGISIQYHVMLSANQNDQILHVVLYKKYIPTLSSFRI